MVRQLNPPSQPPPMPTLLELLISMSGCKNTPPPKPSHGLARKQAAKLEKLGPTIRSMISDGMSGTKIAEAIDMPRSTVHVYIRKIKETA